MKFTVTYSRTFTMEIDCVDLDAADGRAKAWSKNFPAGEVKILSIYPEGYVEPAEPVMTKMELMVDGMRKKINSMLPKETA
jgi:hypothetical protein